MARSLALSWLRALAALLALSLLLGLPALPGHMLGPGHRGPVLELSLLLAALTLLRIRVGSAAAWLLGSACWLVLLLRLADLLALLTAGRLFEPAFDPGLVPALWDVLSRGAGGLVLGLGLLTSLLGLLCLCRWLAGLMLRPVPDGGHRRFAMIAALALLTLIAGQPMGRGAIGAVLEQGQRWRAAQEMQARMQADLAHDPAASLPADRLLAALRGRTIILAWVESYGFSALVDPRQAPLVRQRLASLDASLAEGGFRIRSGRVESPVIGGRSWLAHGTMRAGIRQDQPLAQQLVLASGRCGLVCALDRAGWRTMAAMPGLALPWLEGPAWGFGQVLDRGSFGYAGPGFGWSPLPDQALLASLHPNWTGPLYLEIVLTSSHAPRTPLPPWKDDPAGLADGSAYADADLRTDYRDMAAGYGRSLDYSLWTLGDWLRREVPANALVIILGDHPALDWISTGAGRQVPIHFLSRDAALLDRLDGMDLTDGMIPNGRAPPLPMWEILSQLLDRFGPNPLQHRPIHADMQEKAGEAVH